MAPNARAPRERWVDAALAALARGGVDAVRVEVLATHIGVTKGSFYGHFAGRGELLAALLDEWERRSTNDVLAQVEAEGRSPRDRIRRVAELTFSDDLHQIDLAVRSWARHDPAVAARLRGVDNVRMDFLRAMFGAFLEDPDEVEARSTLAFSLVIGRHFIAADHPDGPGAASIRLAGELLLRPER